MGRGFRNGAPDGGSMVDRLTALDELEFEEEGEAELFFVAQRL